jgi:hypothetical protein
VEEPRRADERVARERELRRGSEDAQPGGRSIVHEHGFAEPEVGGYALAVRIVQRGGIDEDSKRVAAATIRADEYAQHVEARRHSQQATTYAAPP